MKPSGSLQILHIDTTYINYFNSKIVKIYTKTGDSGSTGLFGGERISKDDIRIEAYGTVDELNAQIGVLRSSLSLEGSLQGFDSFLNDVQKALFVIGSELASKNPEKLNLKSISEVHIVKIETQIDDMQDKLELLKTFILPGGHTAAAQSHICRTVCRRAERRAVTLAQHEDISEDVIKYLNRLSDYFFVLSRAVNQVTGFEDVAWIPEA